MPESITTHKNSVHTRIAWSSIFAGALVALVALVVLSAVGTAVGLTARRGDSLAGMGSLIWAIVVAIVALFVGGWTASRLVVRETMREAAAYGVILWGVIYVSLLVFSYFGIFTTFNMLMGLSGTWSISAVDVTILAQELGLTPEQILRLQEALLESYGATNPLASAWWSLAGIIASLAAASAGSMIGSERQKMG